MPPKPHNIAAQRCHTILAKLLQQRMASESITSFLTLSPASSVQLPGSKSLSIRALLLAALSQGQTTLDGVLNSDDASV
jgi:5-enolpyruvylshikimate-3-phosphate synthase